MTEQETAKKSDYHIHFSSLREEEKTELKEIVSSKLGGVVDENLYISTKYLICTSVDNLKHRLAKTMGIKVVNPQWIKDSGLKGEWLATNSYELDLFEGVKIGVVGFNKKDFEEIVSFILPIERNS